MAPSETPVFQHTCGPDVFWPNHPGAVNKKNRFTAQALCGPTVAQPVRAFQSPKEPLPRSPFLFFRRLNDKYSLLFAEIRNPPYFSILECVKTSKRRVSVQREGGH